MTALEVLTEINAARRANSAMDSVRDSVSVVETDRILRDLQERLLKDYGDLRRDTQLQEWKHK